MPNMKLSVRVKVVRIVAAHALKAARQQDRVQCGARARAMLDGQNANLDATLVDPKTRRVENVRFTAFRVKAPKPSSKTTPNITPWGSRKSICSGTGAFFQNRKIQKWAQKKFFEKLIFC